MLLEFQNVQRLRHAGLEGKKDTKSKLQTTQNLTRHSRADLEHQNVRKT